MLVLTSRVTNRIEYIFELLLYHLFDIEVDFTTDIDEFNSFEGEKISYGINIEDKSIFFAASTLLFERKISPKILDFRTHKDTPIFFCNNDENSVLPFDIFAASFYLVARYEEYLPFKADIHGRFPAEESIAYKNNFLRKPLVNIWATWLRDYLIKKYPNLKVKNQIFTFTPTLDVDSAFQYKNKGLLRTLGGIFFDIKNDSKNATSNISKRFKVIFNKEKDPFDNFDYYIKLHSDLEKEPIYFVLLADFSNNNPNISFSNHDFQNIILKINDYGTVGIHPSYKTYNDSFLLEKELNRLESIINDKISYSRQHFLRFKLPDTYNNLIKSELTHDFSMGYSKHLGFRASICTPFYFYNLLADYKTKFIIHPFAIMDGALETSLRINNDTAFEDAKNIIDDIYSVNGDFSIVWHNHALNNNYNGLDWLLLYERILNYTKILLEK